MVTVCQINSAARREAKMKIKITETSAVLLPDGRWRGIVRLGNTGTIEIVRDTHAEAWAFCQHHINRENSENE